jgi:isoleucyl-tRNA synthetase
MSKSLGNIIAPFEVVDKYGADTLRYYTSKIRAGEDIAWSWDELKQHYRNLSILHNVGNFMLDLAKQNGYDSITLTDEVFTAARSQYGAAEKYIISKTHSALKQITSRYDNYELHLVAVCFEELLLELSRTYIQAVREKASEEPDVVLSCIIDVFSMLLPMAYPIIPFTTEYWYKQGARAFCSNPEQLQSDSLMLQQFPRYDESLIDEKLEADFTLAGNALGAILACREKLNRGVRWPIGSVILSGPKFSLVDYVCSQANVKSLEFRSFDGLIYSVAPNYKNLGREFGVSSAGIISQLTALSGDEAHSLALELLAKGSVSFGGVVLTENHIVLSQKLPEGFVSAEYAPGAYVFIANSFDSLLDLEGYARELIRRIQSARKLGGYEKSQELSVKLTLSSILLNAYAVHEETILKRCGLVDVVVEGFESGSSLLASAEKIKDESFSIEILT